MLMTYATSLEVPTATEAATPLGSISCWRASKSGFETRIAVSDGIR
jgi:hypothetical protein